ncbi:GNAT family N-acetyltransferase [Devosia sp.]|uniref:GNAT family N-acetyltransferase n=1 Tax=Devosia sp. TaxID=1871048 RepID=UPI003A94180D
MTITYRRIGPGDAALLRKISPGVFDEKIDRERLIVYLREPGHLMLLALDDDTVVGQCVGVLHYHPDKPTELYVDELGTADAYLRRGIGEAMMQAMFDWARELGVNEAWIGTETDNDPANALYRKLDPVEDETIQYYLFRL